MNDHDEVLALIERHGPANEARLFYEALKAAIIQMSNALTDSQRLVISMQTSRGDMILVRGLGFINPNLLYIFGKDAENDDTTVLAHPCTVQLIAKRLGPVSEQPVKRPIGFLDEIPATGQEVPQPEPAPDEARRQEEGQES